MKIDHVHFYVEDAPKTRDWFVQQLGFHFIASGTHGDTRTEVVKSGSACFVLSSPLGAASPVAEFLRSHPSGVFDLAFRVEDLPTVTLQAVRQGAKLLKPTQVALSDSGCLQWSQITGWGGLKHSLIERSGITALLPAIQLFHADGNIAYLGLEESEVSDPAPADPKAEHRPLGITGIDHVVLNVATGDLERAVHWYQQSLGFHLQQSFKIQTERSALRSQVMVYPGTTLQFPINEPASANSQIQEFLDINRGPGIQHIALQTSNLVQIIAQLRQRGIDFLSVPPSYYQQLQQRQGFALLDMDWEAIAAQEILVDWQQEIPAVLLQIFTQPIFEQPTFFLELIERQVYWLNNQPQRVNGFGEGNFQALFEAIEQEQINRGSLEEPL